MSVGVALRTNRSVRDIRGGLSTQALADYLKLWDLVSKIALIAHQPDQACWRFSSSGTFSVSSSYNMFFMANTRFACAKPIWRSKAPMKCKFFMWLVVHKRCLTADNLARRGWPCDLRCPLCSSENEDCTHLFVHCRFTQQLWFRIRLWSGANFPTPGNSYLCTEDWWLSVRKQAPKQLHKDFDTFTILVHWRI